MDALFEIAKAPYRPPSLAEIRAKWNGLVAVSTFSGCGGSSTGLKMAGWSIPYAVEFIPAARETYLANYPTTFVDARDVRDIDPAEILEKIGLAPGELDLFEGSPPCSSFSTANTSADSRFGNMKVKDYSEGVKQTTDDLFDEWLRLVEGIMPRAILAENVPGLLLDDARDFYLSILSRLEGLGYLVNASVYDAMHFGAATSRKRLIISGVREDVSPNPPPAPRRSEYGYTIGDALETLPSDPTDEELSQATAVGYAIFDEWAKLRPGQSGTKIAQVRRCRYDEPLPSPTVVGKQKGSANPMHPVEPRKWTATELAHFFGYPPDYVFTGNAEQRYERVARSVAPPLYAAHGAVLAELLGGDPIR